MIESKNGIIGFAIGDAMGVPVEFCIREKLMQNPIVEMKGYGSHDVPKGSWSDDTSMTLATVDSINDCGKINIPSIAKNFILWIEESKYTPTDRVFDIGRTTLRALSRCENDITKAENAGGNGEMDNGNGSLMRILPIAYYCFANNFDYKEIYEIVKSVSSITHRHEISIMGCYIYVCFAIELLKGNNKNKAYKNIKKIDYFMFSQNTIEKYKRLLEKDINKLKIDDISTQGYVVSTLEATFWVLLNTNSFNQAIIGAINLGNDTDTVGACVGGLAGIIYGIENINADWKIDLIRYNYIKELSEKFDKVLFPNNEVKSDTYNVEEIKRKVKIEQGDITELTIDCIVNAANSYLIGGGGVDGAIHFKAGNKLDEKCKELNGCQTGFAKITRGYDLNSKYIIHTVAPKWFDNRVVNKEELLRSCYENSLKLARDYGIKTIAFPCIGMGIYSCPSEIGAKIAIDVAVEFACKYDFEKIILVCYEKNDFEKYIEYYSNKLNN